MASWAEREFKKCLRAKKGLVVIIGDTFTGKTYTANKLIKKLGVEVISFDYDSLGRGKNPDKLAFVKQMLRVSPLNFSKKKSKPRQKILYCDAIESYSSSTLTFLKNARMFIPIIATCDRSIVIPNMGDIYRIWWKGPKRNPPGWRGDTSEKNPRDLFVTLTQRRIPTKKAVQNFDNNSFILTQYFHDEFPTYKKTNVDLIADTACALSKLDYMRCKQWSSAGFGSGKSAKEDIFVRHIRQMYRNPCIIPTGWFPRTLGKSSQIQKRQQELCTISHTIPNIRDLISVFTFKIGRSFAYKKIAPSMGIDPYMYSRALALTGNRELTENETKKILKQLKSDALKRSRC
jgi:hypothetical protein